MEPSDLGTWLQSQLLATVANLFRPKGSKAITASELMGRTEKRQQTAIEQKAILSHALAVSRHANGRKS